ncbi:putative C6 transcription factor [Talaromyces proteolyticus]|uniref:C6 transcription factor n=1 Tax=Talaromyces proteolyticus TaxID=1131652 RepID=A0AAD4L3V6_9EURO|nr:putative C6 transcription factor [Talaromyces proteolyticus]KAH8705457.1 putative C6 transcription factor [Talaromyces proteolyticus]
MRNPSLETGRSSEHQDQPHVAQPDVEIRRGPSKNLDEPPLKPREVSENTKAKRVRTGCLTCRERHLKCDETLPRCQNCSKSGRVCKRGIRLNFIDTQTVSPPYDVTPPPGTRFNFQDESREIASEYVGGYERYPTLNHHSENPKETTSQFDLSDILNAPVLQRQPLPASPPILPSYSGANHHEIHEPLFNNTQYTTQSFIQQSNFLPKPSVSSSDTRPYLNSPEEVLLMQVFVEEVGLWMDSMNIHCHFTQKLPLRALSEPMLLNAMMACGAQHLHLVNASFSEDRALHYYNTASRELMTHLKNPDRDSVLCAIAAVILNSYELMCKDPMQRMNHIAGARALIKECRWDGKASGIGNACFWLNVGVELLSCLHFNWQMAWNPDSWGMDMESELTPSQSLFGDEELWTHRMVYICAKVANFRASIPEFQELDRHTHQMRIQQRCHEWNTYQRWCDEWAKCVPHSMMPMGYLQSWQTTSKSAFPEIWLIKRPAIVGRLFYHTACVLLAKIHPIEPEFSPEMRDKQQRHAYDICGIVAHVKDRGVATMSIRCLAIAAECLVSRDAQQELLDILDKIIKEAGWRIDFLKSELQEKWGWHQSETRGSTPISSNLLLNSETATSSTHPKLPSGIVNPTMAAADFSMANHPYQDYYVAPHTHTNDYHYLHTN